MAQNLFSRLVREINKPTRTNGGINICHQEKIFDSPLRTPFASYAKVSIHEEGRFKVEAAGVEPASENIPLQLLRTYPLI